MFANLSVHVVTGSPRPTTAAEDMTTMNDLTETTEMLDARLAAQTAITEADTRDALLRTALSLPNNLQYLTDGGIFASTVVDLVRAIADARLAKHRAATGYLRGSGQDRARWDAERLQGLAARG